MNKREDFKTEMIGKRFGKLTVVSHVSRDKGYLCSCDCGGTTIARSSSLKSGRHTSCACGRQRPKRKGSEEAPLKRHYDNYRRAAIRRGYEFNLTFEEFKDIVLQKCNYCGEKDSIQLWNSGQKHYSIWANGVDRVDNNTGYTTDNCVCACKVCNNAKGTLTTEEFTEWIRRIASYQNTK